MELLDMYNISDYIICQPLNKDEILMYSTLSTSVIVLEKEVFTDIFANRKFEMHPIICTELEQMGFLFSGDQNSQADLLENIRQEIAYADHGITSITIAPTMECNAQCYYCFEKGAIQGTMSIQTAQNLVNFIVKYCTEKEIYISWFGGEPLLATDIIDYISDKLLDSGIKIESTITTNGLLLNDVIINKFRKWNVTRVQITLDGVGQEYDRIKNYKTVSEEKPFDVVMCNIENLISNEINVHLRVNYASKNYSIVESTMEYLNKRFGDYKYLYLYGVPLDLPDIKGYSEFDEIEGEIFLKVLHMSLDNGYENDELDFRSGVNISGDYNAALGELMLSPFPASCYMTNKFRFVIDHEGNIYKCQKHLGKPEFGCGNVKSGLVKNKTYDHYVTSKVHDKNCEKCFLFPICQGGCNANRLLYGNKFACPPSKSIAKKLVMSYYTYLQNDGIYK